MTNYLLLLYLLLCQGMMGDGVKVLEFQKDGMATDKSMANYNGSIDRSWTLDSLTLCARFQLFFMHSRATFFQLQDQQEGLYAQLKGEIWLDRVRPVIAHQWKFQMITEKFSTYRWYHLCFTYDHKHHRYSTYVDGKLVSQSIYDIGRQVYGDYARLGQGEDVEHSFSGALAQVNIWDQPLSADTISEIASCRIDPKGNYISWDETWTIHNITEYQKPLRYFCEAELKLTYLWFPQSTWDFAQYICRALGTSLPMPETMEEVKFWHNLSAQTWRQNPTLCQDGFWTPVEDSRQEGEWVTYDGKIVPSLAWKNGEPNGIMYENCAHITKDGVEDTDCLNKRCSVCKFTHRQTFTLLGTCEAELRNTHFTVSQKHASQLLFQGYGDYQIREEDNEWIWVNIVKNQILARLDPHASHGKPMGRRIWFLEAPICGQVMGSRTLTLSPCPIGSYTCDDGTCIQHDERCDFKYDCFDRSDELNCKLVVLQTDYNKNVPPRTQTVKNETLLIAIEVVIESLDIDTPHMTMQVSYELKMTWYDNRLIFQDLKFDESLNIVSDETMMSLWIPHIGYINTGSHQNTKVDKEASLYLKRLEDAMKMDKSAPGEVALFSGRGNPLIITRNYFTNFMCDFNLVLYPFDQQYCEMHLRILSASKEYVTMNEMATKINYTGSKLLLEYQLHQPTIHHDNSNSHSEVKIRLPLKRRRGYALCDIYIPSCVLLFIGYMSLYFQTHIFEVRIMTTLTSLLVMATLFSQVSASLPKTSYFKMVDVWLLFCIVMSFLIIIFHTIIDISLGEYANPQYNTQPIKVTPITPLQPPLLTIPSTWNTFKNTIDKFKFNEFNTKFYISLAQYSVSGLFLIFNIVYWTYIFA